MERAAGCTQCPTEEGAAGTQRRLHSPFGAQRLVSSRMGFFFFFFLRQGECLLKESEG